MGGQIEIKRKAIFFHFRNKIAYFLFIVFCVLPLQFLSNSAFWNLDLEQGQKVERDAISYELKLWSQETGQ